MSNQSITAAPSLLSDFNVTHSVDLYASYVRRLVDQGGPREVDYADLDHWVIDVYDGIRAGQLSTADIAEIRAAFGEALSSKTMQGFALTKPHGYAGDFEMIDRIYQIHIAPWSLRPPLGRWRGGIPIVIFPAGGWLIAARSRSNDART